MVNNSSGICAGDFNGDGILDLATTFQYYDEPPKGVQVFLGRGDGTFPEGVGYATDDHDATGIACADLSGDGIADLIVGTLDGATILLGHGDGTFGAGVTYLTQPQNGHSLVVADFNGDGKLDVVINNEYGVFGNSVSVLLGNGDGTLRAASYFQSGLGDYADLTTGDFNNDGAMDLGEAASGNALAPGYGFVSLQTNGSAILFSAAALDFNAVQLLGTQSAPQSVVMTNVGKERLDIARIGLLGTNPHDFQQSNNCGTSLPIGSSCQIDVTFDPQDRGWRRTSLTVTANTITHDQSISLFGVATSVTLSPSSLNFGNQKVGTVSDPQVVTLTNVGNKPVSIYSLGIIGQFPQVFLQTNTCGTSVAAGASCTINVQFAPQLTRGFIESLGVKDDGGGQTQKIQVAGTGT
jgi:FG-GAP-like repeat/HYDIN/CFA65/VesB-like, Ig-like domain/FG-GAP repeat